VRSSDLLADGRIKRLTLTLAAGSSPDEFAFDADLASFFDAPGFAVPATFGGTTAMVLLDTPDDDVLTGRAASTEYTLTLRAPDWPAIARGGTVSVPPCTYVVREVRHLGDGATKQLRMTKQ
jgi:hypothetical protein